MSRKADKARSDARDLRDRLKAEGRYRDAQIIQTLVLSAENSSRLNAVLYRDNDALRDRVRQAEMQP